jgi:tetratricopeptide (TPR) repeat protein
MDLNSFFQNNEVFCQKIIRDFPKASRPFWILGLTYLESRQYDKAIASFQHYLDIKEDNPFVREVRQDYFIHHQMGRCYVYDHKKAIAEFQKSIQLRPGYALAHADLAKAYLLTENYQAALGHAVKAVELDGNLIFGYVYAIHSALELGERAQAQEFMKKALTVSPEDPNLHYLKNRMATE